MKVYVLVRMVGGFAREDAHEPSVVAVLVDKEKAEKLSRTVFDCTTFEMELDHIPSGWIDHAKAMGLDL